MKTHDIRMSQRAGIQPVKLDTASRIKKFGWKKFEQVDSPEAQPQK